MKTTAALLTTLLATTIYVANAQYSEAPPPDNGNRPPTGYFEIGIGITQPMNSFANATGAGYGGYAMPGNNLNLAFGIPIQHSNFGVAMMYNYTWNRYDIDSYVSNVQYSDQSNTYTPLQHSWYQESFILGGLFVTIPVQRLSFDFRFMGGVAICGLPEVDYGADATSVAASQDPEWDTYSSSSSSFASDIGGGLRFKINHTVIMANVDYMNADPMISTTQRATDQYGNSTYTHIGGSIPISLMSYSIGIGYQFR
jgi:hypothetical protein